MWAKNQNITKIVSSLTFHFTKFEYLHAQTFGIDVISGSDASVHTTAHLALQEDNSGCA